MAAKVIWTQGSNFYNLSGAPFIFVSYLCDKPEGVSVLM